jgi:hypothetical protein
MSLAHELKASTIEVIQRTFEKAGIIFIDANDGGPGARLRRPPRSRPGRRLAIEPDSDRPPRRVDARR